MFTTAGAIAAVVAVLVLLALAWFLATTRRGSAITVNNPDRFHVGMRIETGDGRRWIVAAIEGVTLTVRRQ